MEITMHNLQAGGRTWTAAISRAGRLLAACGKTVLISDYFEYYRLAAYLAWYTKESIGMMMGSRAFTTYLTKSITRNCPAGLWKVLDGCLRMT